MFLSFKTQRYDCCDVRTLMVARPSIDRSTDTTTAFVGGQNSRWLSSFVVCVCVDERHIISVWVGVVTTLNNFVRLFTLYRIERELCRTKNQLNRGYIYYIYI